MQTKDGSPNPGTTCRRPTGQYGRGVAASSSPAAAWDNGVNWYATGNLFTRGRLARRFAVDARPALRQGRLARRRDRRVADRRLRRHRSHRQRTAGAALPRARLRERLHEARQHGQPVAASSTWSGSHAVTDDVLAVRQRLTTARSGRRPSTATSTTTRSTRPSTSRTRPSRRRSPAAGYTGFPTSGRKRGEHAVSVLALHRQRAAATTSRTRSATACSIAPDDPEPTGAPPAR